METIVVYHGLICHEYGDVPEAVGIFSSLEKAKTILLGFANDMNCIVDPVNTWSQTEVNIHTYHGTPPYVSRVYEMNFAEDTMFQCQIRSIRLDHLNV